MSLYNDPLYPSYEATRYQIQKTIYGLQDKLRRRKQLDILLERDFIQKQDQLRLKQIINNKYAVNQIEAQHQIRNNIRRVNLYDGYPMTGYQRYLQPRTNFNVQSQLIRSNYYDRLHQLQYQRQMIYNNSSEINKLSKFDDDQILVKKYQDGSKINQYNYQLQASNTKNKYYSQTQKYSSLQKNHNDFIKPNIMQGETPYQKLRSNEKQFIQHSTVKKYQEPKLQKNNSKRKLYKQVIENQNEFRNQNELRNQKLRQNNKQTKPQPQKFKNQQLSQSKEIRKSRSKSRNNENSKKRQNKSSNNLSKVSSPEQSALKKIQNRLMVSSVIYQDSQYKNVKHQQTHLYGTYEIELKIRKQIKDKINNHPNILKKHAMVTN